MKSYIILLFKSGIRSDILNYRGIAKINAIPKLLEKMITNLLYHQISLLLSLVNTAFVNLDPQQLISYNSLQLSMKDFRIKCRLMWYTLMGFSDSSVKLLNYICHKGINKSNLEKSYLKLLTCNLVYLRQSFGPNIIHFVY